MKLLTSCFVSALLFLSHPLYAKDLPTKDTRSVRLNKIFDGRCINAPRNVLLTVSYDYDFARGIGMAKTVSIGDKNIALSMFPLGVASKYIFMTDTSPVPAEINGIETYIYRVTFTLHKDGHVDGLIMLGQDGECVLTSTLED